MRILSTDEVKALQSPPFLIEGMIPDKGLVMVFGHEASYKTFWALDGSLCIANGVSHHGLETMRGAVLYVAAEGGAPLGKRIRAWDEAHGTDSKNCLFVMEPINLDDPLEVAVLRREIRERNEKPPKTRIRLVVFDTLALCRGEDENGSAEMSHTIRNLKGLVEGEGLTVLLVHHSPKGNDGTHRGSGALSAAMTTNIRVAYEGGKVILDCRKQKDAKPFEKMVFEPHEVGESVVLKRVQMDKSDIDELARRITASDQVVALFAAVGVLAQHEAVHMLVQGGMNEKTAKNTVSSLKGKGTLVDAEGGLSLA